MSAMDAYKIKRLRLQNFTCFRDLEMEFSLGINVFIGENGTGKTHLLKVLYGLNNFGDLDFQNLDESVLWPELHFWNNIVEIFKVQSIYDLINRHSASSNGLISSDLFSGAHIELPLNSNDNFHTLSQGGKVYGHGFTELDEKDGKKDFPIKVNASYYERNHNTLFIPLLELLSWYQGFERAYEKRENSIDVTYYFLAKALSLLPLKGQGLKEAKQLLEHILDALPIDVRMERGEFFVTTSKNSAYLEAKLMAQGINKIAQIIHLTLNGSLTKNTLLFWDEPESGLNPKYVAIIAQFLQTLAEEGVQLFVATHDYLLTHLLSLSAEYRAVENSVPDMKFFSLYKGEVEGTQVESGATLSAIEHNPILDEYAALHDRELGLY